MAIKNSLIIMVVVQFFNCAGTNYKKLSIENPTKLVAIQDSLLSVSGNNQRIRDALVTANNNVAKRYLNKFAILNTLATLPPKTASKKYILVY